MTPRFSKKDAILIGPMNPDFTRSQILKWENWPIIAIDSGADVLLGQSRLPEAVVGDLDSLSEAARAAFAPLLLPISEQESTDFHKALRSTKAEIVHALGVMGGRFDHALAMLSALAQQSHRKVIVRDAENCLCLCPPELHLDLPKGMALSLYPLGEVACHSEGLLWPTAGIAFSPIGRIGTSNEVAGPVVLRPSAPVMLLILPAEAHDALREGLLAVQTWPQASRLARDLHY